MGIRLKTSPGPRDRTSPSLDRLKPHLGYTKGNVAVISDYANRIKQDATPEEVMAVARWMETIKDP